MISGGEAGARAYVAERTDQTGMARLDRLIAALIEENSRQNLISKPSEATVWQRHIADSAQLLDLVPRETEEGPWMDLGSGAGFPGLVLAAMHPDRQIILVESRARRVEWLSRMAIELQLPNCRVEGKRLELVEPFPARVITARAFAPLPKLLDLSSPFSTSQTLFLLPKGRSAKQELQELPKRSRAMFHVEQSQTDMEAGIIVGNPGKTGR